MPAQPAKSLSDWPPRPPPLHLAGAHLLALILVLVFMPHAASGAVLDVTAGFVYRADSGVANYLTFTRLGAGVSVSDRGAPILISGAGCAYTDLALAHEVLCALDPSTVDIDVGDRDDRVTLAPAAIACQRGDCFASVTELGPGNDQFYVAFPNPDRRTSREVVNGGDGSDHIETGEGADSINGGPGNDTIAGGPDYDPLNGFDDDGISGGPGDDSLDGGPDEDGLSGDEGADTLIGGGGNDSLESGPGEDSLSGGLGNDQLESRPDNFGDDTVDGGPGNDRGGVAPPCPVQECAQSNGSDTFIGGPGSDVMGYGWFTAPVSVSLDGIANDGLAAEGDNVLPDVESVSGGEGADTLIGNEDANVLAGGYGLGSDRLEGRGGNDQLFGGEGATWCEGGPGHHRVVGSAGSDAAPGGAGDDELTGHDGRDSLDGGGGNDVVAGEDLIGLSRTTPSGADDVLNGGDGDDVVMGGPGTDTVGGGAGDDRLDSPTLGQFPNERTSYNFGDDTLDGGPGNDLHVSGIVCFTVGCAQ